MILSITPPSSRASGRVSNPSATAYAAESTALYATARLWDDGLIDPRDTRAVLAFCLATCAEADARAMRPNSFGVARI